MVTAEATGAEFGAKSTKFPGSASANPTGFVRHDTYFFKDGNIVFLVDGTLFCVHRYYFSRDSAYVSTKFGQLDVRDHEPLRTIISLGDVERKDFEAFLSVIYPINFEEHNLSYEQWKSVLRLSTRWGFASLRNLALKSIKSSTPFDKLLLARTNNVDHWVIPALSALCTRTTPITLKEARQMSIEDVVLIATVREEIHSLRPFVEIERRIEAAQLDIAIHVKNDDVSSGGSESGAAQRELPKEAVAGTRAKADSYNGTKEVVVSKTVDIHRNDEHPAGTAGGERVKEEDVKSARADSYKGTKEVAVAITSKVVHSDWGGGYQVETAEDEWVIPERIKKKKGHTEEIAEDEWPIPVRTKKKKRHTAKPLDESAIPVWTRKHKKHTIETTEDEWAIPVRTKKRK